MVKTPIVLHIRSKDAVYYTTYADGSAGLSYCFPQAFDLYEAHAIKLLYLHGCRKPVLVQFTYVELQGLNRDIMKILGTSIPGSNVYIPVSNNYIPASGGIILTTMDCTPITELDDICLGLHLVPMRLLDCRHQ